MKTKELRNITSTEEEIMLTKSQELLYYIIKQKGEVEDKTKLAKLQYLSDFIHYAFNNKPISEDTTLYTRQKQGPLARTFDDDITTLKANGLVSEEVRFHYKPSQDFEVQLSEKEKETVDFVLNKYGNLSYDELVELTHNQAPYLSSTDKSVIEFFTAYNLVDEYPDYPTTH